jgi:hypothetical protein
MVRTLATAVLITSAVSAAAQTEDKPDPGCVWSTAPVTLQQSDGRMSILHVKHPTGVLNCTKTGNCRNEVEVKMFKRQADGSDACCYRIEWGEMRVTMRHKNVPIRWKLKSVDLPAQYEFDSPPVEFLVATTPDDFGNWALEGSNKTAKLISVNKRKLDFGYRLAISRVYPGTGTRLACDKADPLIGNQGQ